jgi:hypothetical protein
MSVSFLLLAGVCQGLAIAEDKPRQLSIEFSGGIRPDMAGLGETIAKDGTIDVAETTVASLLYSTDMAFMSDQANQTIWHNSNDTSSTFKLLSEEPVLGGGLLGGEIGGRLRYELNDRERFPLFVQAGVYYTQRIAGGYQERVLGDVAQQNATVAALLVLNGEDPEDFIHGKMSNQYDASWIEIPIGIGLKAPHPTRKNTAAYGSVGVSLFRGGFSVGFDIDERYANALSTHIDTDEMTVTNLSPGAVSDEIRFDIQAVGLNYGMGVQAGLGEGAAFFMELNSSGAAQAVYGSELKPETKQLLTAGSSANLAAEDPEWFDTIAYPVLTTGASFRVGMRYYFF